MHFFSFLLKDYSSYKILNPISRSNQTKNRVYIQKCITIIYINILNININIMKIKYTNLIIYDYKLNWW